MNRKAAMPVQPINYTIHGIAAYLRPKPSALKRSTRPKARRPWRMGEERRSCAAAGVTEGARGTQGQAAQVALQGGPGFPGAERNGAETQLRPTRKRDVGAPRRRAAQRNAAEQRGSPVGWAGSNLSRRSFRRSLRRRDGRRRNHAAERREDAYRKAHWRAICGGGARPERTESRPCGRWSQGQRRERRKGGAGAGCPEGSGNARGDQSARERTPQDGCAARGAPDEDGSGRAG